MGQRQSLQARQVPQARGHHSRKVAALQVQLGDAARSAANSHAVPAGDGRVEAPVQGGRAGQGILQGQQRLAVSNQRRLIVGVQDGGPT